MVNYNEKHNFIYFFQYGFGKDILLNMLYKTSLMQSTPI